MAANLSHEGRIATSVPGITGRADGTNLKRQCSLTIIASYQVDYVIYTDGSASRGTRNGGAAAVVTRGLPLQLDVITTIKTNGRTSASSYEEETAAIESALTCTLTNASYPSISILFCIDRKSLCEALISSHPRTFSIHNSINSISSSIFIQWIPGHSVVPGNDIASKAAKEGTTIATDTILPISLSSSIQVINEMICDASPTHERVASVYQHRRVFGDAKQISNRKDDVFLARLRSGDQSPFSQAIPPPTWSFTRSDLSELPPRRTRSLRMSGFDGHKTTSVWVPSRVFRMACHSTWGCSGVLKEDPGQPWHLTQ